VVGQISVEELVEGVPVSEVLTSVVVGAIVTSRKCNLERSYVNPDGKWIVFNRSKRTFTSHTLTWLLSLCTMLNSTGLARILRFVVGMFLSPSLLLMKQASLIMS
jgi:hypothetical protein